MLNIYFQKDYFNYHKIITINFNYYGICYGSYSVIWHFELQVIRNNY